MKISILTLFPEMFAGPFEHSIVKRAQNKNIVEIDYINIRDFGEGAHKIVDDTPYSGGIGMILKVDVLHKAIEKAKALYKPQNEDGKVKRLVVLTSASGKLYKQKSAMKFSRLDHLIIICGHYEGVDERILNFVDEEIAIGDFVLTGGEIPAMLIVDSVVRLLKGVITEGAAEEESFSENGKILEYPHYTKPRIYNGFEVPDILLNGNHQKISEWRLNKSKEKTKINRPDLLKNNS
jgi:tRNA (guanine37-N1)-methyltransferase